MRFEPAHFCGARSLRLTDPPGWLGGGRLHQHFGGHSLHKRLCNFDNVHFTQARDKVMSNSSATSPESRPLRIAHLSVARVLHDGQLRQLECELAMCDTLVGVEWVAIAWQAEPSQRQLVRQIPRLFRPMFLRNLFGWLVLMRLSRENDFVLMRHMTFDPFALIFAPFVRNRVSVHHAKEVEELPLIAPGWRGRCASALELLTGRVAVHNAVLVAGVTNEIADYEVSRHAAGKPTVLYGNGVALDQYHRLRDTRTPGRIEAIFLCSVFSPWHGLDKLIDAVDKWSSKLAEPQLTIHLVGELDALQMEALGATDRRRAVFVAHGVLKQKEYRPLMDRCHIGFGSLALERQSLFEGSTLKVREMLAMGLPVYSGHRDADIPENFAYYRNASDISVEDMLNFAQTVQPMTREDVATFATPYISKKAAMMRVANLLASLRATA